MEKRIFLFQLLTSFDIINIHAMLQVYAPSQYLLKKEILILTSVSLEALLLLIGEQIVELQ